MRTGLPPLRWRRAPDDEGAIALITGIVMAAVLVTIAAFAVDLGSQRVVRRDMQALADVVALDLGRLVDGRTRQQINQGYGDRVPLAAALAASVANNDTTTLGTTDSVEAFLVRLDQNGGYATTGNGNPSPVLDHQVPDAVVVVASGTVGFAFGILAEGSATRSAVAATKDPQICFSMGTKALGLGTEASPLLNPLLKALLGDEAAVTLDAIGYNGIADLSQARVPLLGLAAELGVGTVDELLTTQVGLGSLMLAAARALAADGHVADAAALEMVAVQLEHLQVRLGDFLDVEGGGAAGLRGEVDALSLLTAAAAVANRENALAVAAGIPGVGNVNVTVIEPPRIACGGPGTVAHSAQIRVALDVNAAALDWLKLPVGTSLRITLEVASGTATLEDLACAPEQATFTVRSGLVDLLEPSGLTVLVAGSRVLDVLGPLGGVLRLLLTPVIGSGDVSLDIDLAGVAAASETALVDVAYPPPPQMPPTHVVPSGSLGNLVSLGATDVRLSAGQGSLVSILGSLLGQALQLITVGIVEPLLNRIGSDLLEPLLDLLGAQAGIAELGVQSRPACTDPQLIG